MKSKGETKIPVFQSLEEEREYWESRGPLAKGHRGKINKPVPKQKRTSFLSIRLSGEELSLIRDMAAETGLSPSTYARRAILLAMKVEHKTRKLAVKPLPQMLDERVKALLRRTQGSGFKPEHSVAIGGNLTIDFATHEVLLSGKPVKLTPTEYRLLSELVRNEGRVITHSTLLEMEVSIRAFEAALKAEEAAREARKAAELATKASGRQP